MQPQLLIILGAGGHGREIADIVAAINNMSPQPRWELLGFLDDDPEKKGGVYHGVPVLGGLEWTQTWSGARLSVVCGVGDSVTRLHLAQRAGVAGLGLGNLVHPSAVLTPHITWGQGIVIAAGALLTNSISLGDHVHLNLSATVSHDCVLEDCCTLAPGAHLAGNVHLGEGCNVGMGATIIQGVTVGEWSIIGAGAVVTHDLPANVTAVGVPARVIKERPAGWHLAELAQSTH